MISYADRTKMNQIWDHVDARLSLQEMEQHLIREAVAKGISEEAAVEFLGGDDF